MTEEKTSLVAGTRVNDASTRSFISDPQKELPQNNPQEKYFWYPMYVKYRKELSVQEELEANEFRTFIPMEEYSVKRGSKVRIETRPAIHNLIFIYSFRERITWMKMFNRQCLHLQYMSHRFLDGHSEVITVSDHAMDNIIRAATADDPLHQRTYLDRSLNLTDLDKGIKFVDGSFKGVEGIIKRVDKNRAMIVPLAGGFNMKITITRASDIEFMK